MFAYMSPQNISAYTSNNFCLYGHNKHRNLKWRNQGQIIHDLSPLLLPDAHQKELINVVEKQMEQINENDIIFCVSKFTELSVRRVFSEYKGKIITVPNAVNIISKKDW